MNGRPPSAVIEALIREGLASGGKIPSGIDAVKLSKVKLKELKMRLRKVQQHATNDYLTCQLASGGNQDGKLGIGRLIERRK